MLDKINFIIVIFLIILAVSTILSIIWLSTIIKNIYRSRNYVLKIKQYWKNSDTFATVLWLLFFIKNYYNYQTTQFDLWNVALIINIYCIVFFSYRSFSPIKITIDGIYIKENFIIWDQISYAKWSGLDLLTFKFRIVRVLIFKNYVVEYKIHCSIEDKKVIDKLLKSKNIKLSQYKI